MFYSKLLDLSDISPCKLDIVPSTEEGGWKLVPWQWKLSSSRGVREFVSMNYAWGAVQVITRLALDGYFNPSVFWYQWDLLTS